MSREVQSGAVDPAVRNVQTIVELERSAQHEKSWSDLLSGRITAFAGTLWFVLAHLVLFVAWAGWNGFAPRAWQFDPYPFGLLTFFVSLEGVLVATFVLIAQNRMSGQDERRDHLHLQIAMLTEQELTIALRMLRRLGNRLGVPPESDEAARTEKLARETDVFELMETLEREMPPEESGE